jgi:hypothetical protein
LQAPRRIMVSSPTGIERKGMKYLTDDIRITGMQEVTAPEELTADR